MTIKNLTILLFTSLINIAFSQIEFVQNNDIIVSKNGIDYENNLLLNSIPSDILDEYIEITNLIEMSESGAIMIIPAKIEIN